MPIKTPKRLQTGYPGVYPIDPKKDYGIAIGESPIVNTSMYTGEDMYPATRFREVPELIPLTPKPVASMPSQSVAAKTYPLAPATNPTVSPISTMSSPPKTTTAPGSSSPVASLPHQRDYEPVHWKRTGPNSEQLVGGKSQTREQRLSDRYSDSFDNYIAALDDVKAPLSDDFIKKGDIGVNEIAPFVPKVPTNMAEWAASLRASDNPIAKDRGSTMTWSDLPNIEIGPGKEGVLGKASFGDAGHVIGARQEAAKIASLRPPLVQTAENNQLQAQGDLSAGVSRLTGANMPYAVAVKKDGEWSATPTLPKTTSASTKSTKLDPGDYSQPVNLLRLLSEQASKNGDNEYLILLNKVFEKSRDFAADAMTLERLYKNRSDNNARDKDVAGFIQSLSTTASDAINSPPAQLSQPGTQTKSIAEPPPPVTTLQTTPKPNTPFIDRLSQPTQADPAQNISPELAKQDDEAWRQALGRRRKKRINAAWEQWPPSNFTSNMTLR
jgi:hypothetical protein